MLRHLVILGVVLSASAAHAITIDVTPPSFAPLPTVPAVPIPQLSGATAPGNASAFHLGINAALLRHPHADDSNSSGIAGTTGGASGQGWSHGGGIGAAGGSNGGGGGGGASGGGGGGGSSGKNKAVASNKAASETQISSSPTPVIALPNPPIFGPQPPASDPLPVVTAPPSKTEPCKDLEALLVGSSTKECHTTSQGSDDADTTVINVPTPSDPVIAQPTSPLDPPPGIGGPAGNVSAVPLPTTLPLMAGALVVVGLAGAVRRRARGSRSA